jgi:hypothetical protein
VGRYEPLEEHGFARDGCRTAGALSTAQVAAVLREVQPHVTSNVIKFHGVT